MACEGGRRREVRAGHLVNSFDTRLLVMREGHTSQAQQPSTSLTSGLEASLFCKLHQAVFEIYKDLLLLLSVSTFFSHHHRNHFNTHSHTLSQHLQQTDHQTNQPTTTPNHPTCSSSSSPLPLSPPWLLPLLPLLSSASQAHTLALPTTRDGESAVSASNGS